MARFVYEFAEEGPDSLTIDYSEHADEKLRAYSRDGQVYLVGNASGFLTLAKVLIKLARGSYPEGYHVHFSEDFDADKEDVLCVGVASRIG